MIDSFPRRQHLALQQHHLQPTDLPSPALSEPSFFENLPYSISTPSPADFQRTFRTQYFDAPTSFADNFSNSAYCESAQHMHPELQNLNPAIRVQQSTPTPMPTPQFAPMSKGQFLRMGEMPNQPDWEMSGENTKQYTFGGLQNTRANGPIRGSRPHKRAHSNSSMGSSGPASPFNQTTSYPYIANTDHSPQAAGPFDSFPNAEEVATLSKALPTPTQTPTHASFLIPQHADSYYSQGQNDTPSAHLAVKQVTMDQIGVEDDIPAFSRSARHSVSSYGRESPVTPRSSTNEYDDCNQASAGEHPYAESTEWQHDFGLQLHESEIAKTFPKLDRSISDVYQDELYNPAHATQAHPPPAKKLKSNSASLSPMPKNLINERLQEAERYRSQSPAVSSSGPIDNLPGQHLSGDFRPTGSLLQSAAISREQTKSRLDAFAMRSSHLSPSGDAPAKTISPKDALLDYQSSEEEQMSLFPENASADYTSDYSQSPWSSAPKQQSIQTQAFGDMVTSHGHTPGFTTSAPPQSNFPFTVPSTMSAQPTPGYVYSNPTYRSIPTSMSAAPEPTPEFPARLTSMESSMSDVDASMPTDIGRPPRTSADTGTYSCTYHGCPQRFDNPQKLQKHKREDHRSVHHPLTALSSRAGSSDEVASSGSSLSSEALLARNSQAGPHKCERINPSTGKPCNTIFSRPYDLTRHEDTIHNARKQKVRCALCVEEKTFSRNDALTRHMRVVHPEVDFPGKHRRRGAH